MNGSTLKPTKWSMMNM